MGILGQTEFNAFLKTNYAGGVPPNLAKRKKVGLSLFNQKEDLYGDGLKIPLQYGNIGGRSASVTNLYDGGSQMRAASRKAFTITPTADYASISVDALTMALASKDVGAFARARKVEIDSMLDELARSLEISLWRSGSGSIGRRSSISGNVITLTNVADAKNFHVGQTVVFSTADGGGSVKAGSTFVTAVNEPEGKVTVDDITDITSPLDNDYIFVQGDYDAKIKGVEAWIPLTAPSSSLFFGVDRTDDLARLAGHRLSTTSGGIHESIMTLSEMIGDMGGSPDRVFMSHRNFNTLNKDLGSKIDYDGGGGTATIGFEHIKVATSSGTVKVTPVPYMPEDRFYMLQMDTWTLHRNGEIPHIAQEDGLMCVRSRTTDGVDVRARYWAQLACDAPAFNGAGAI